MLRATGAASLRDLRSLVRPASHGISTLHLSTAIVSSRSIGTSSRRTAHAEAGQTADRSGAGAPIRRHTGLRDGPSHDGDRRPRSQRQGQRQGSRDQPRDQRSRDQRPRLTAQQRQQEQDAYGVKDGKAISAEEAWQMWELRRAAEGGIASSPPSFRRAMSKALLSNPGQHSDERLESIVQQFQELHWYDHTIPFLAELIRRKRYEFAYEKIQAIISDETLDRQFAGWSAAVMLASHAANHLDGSPIERIVALVRPLPVRFDIIPRRFVANLRQARTHLSGCPLLTSIIDITAEVGGVPIDITEDDKRTYQHAVLAWGLDDTSARKEEKANILSERIKQATSTGADSGNHDALLEALEVLPEAEAEWLSVSCTNDVKADWNAKTWASLLKALLTRRDNDAATKVWALYTHLNPKGQPVHPALWNALLSGYNAGLEHERVDTVWEQMKTTKDAIDHHCYTTMITILFRRRQPYEAQLLYEEMLEWCKARREVMPVASMNSLIHGLATSGRTEEAAQMVTDMISQTNAALPPPNINTINTMLRAYGRSNDLEGLVSALRAVGPLKLQPDIVTFTTVLDAFGRMGKAEHVSSVYDIMVAQGTQGNTTTFTALIKSALDNGRDKAMAARFDVAMPLLHRMEVSGPKPNEVTYTNIIGALFNHAVQVRVEVDRGSFSAHYGLNVVRNEDLRSLVDVDALWQYRPEVVLVMLMIKRMEQRRMAPNRKTFNTLFEGILRPYTVADTLRAGRTEEEGVTEAVIAKVNLAAIQCARGMLKRMQQSRLDTSERALRILTIGITRFVRLKDAAVTKSAQQMLEDAKKGLSAEMVAMMSNVAESTEAESGAPYSKPTW